MGLGAAIVAAIKGTAAVANKKSNSSSSSSSGSSGSSGSLTASGSGGSYAIGSDKGKNFVNSAAAGSTMTGGDGSTWTKNSDGSTTISKGGQTYTVGGSSGSSPSSNRGSSSGSSGSSSSGASGSYTPMGTHNDATIRNNAPDYASQLDSIKAKWNEAYAVGDKEGMAKWHKDAEDLRSQFGYSGGADGSDYIGTGNMSAPALNAIATNYYNTGYEDYKNQMQAAADAQQSALKAKVDSAVADLESQKYDIGKQTEANNAAAEKAYMNSINPNGSLAENLASQGLLNSGATESSQISAGNTYQNALNSNATTKTEALAQIERAITQARLNGDIEAANALADLMKEVAAKGYENAQNIVSAMQWGNQFALDQAGVTGTYNGAPTLALRQLEMQREQLDEDFANGKIDRETALKQMAYIQAQIENLQADTRYTNAQTTGQNLTNKYYQTQF